MGSVRYGEGVREVALDEVSEVVAGGHGLAVGAAGSDRDEVAPAGGGEKDVLSETVGGFAYRSHDIVAGEWPVGGQVFDVVPGLVEGGTQEVVHAGIDDDEILVLPFLHVENPGDEAAALGNQRTSEFEVYLLTGERAKMLAEGGEVAFEVGNGVEVRMLVVNAQSPAQVEVGEGDTLGLQVGLNGVYPFAQRTEGPHVGDL